MGLTIAGGEIHAIKADLQGGTITELEMRLYSSETWTEADTGVEFPKGKAGAGGLGARGSVARYTVLGIATVDEDGVIFYPDFELPITENGSAGTRVRVTIAFYRTDTKKLVWILNKVKRGSRTVNGWTVPANLVPQTVQQLDIYNSGAQPDNNQDHVTVSQFQAALATLINVGIKADTANFGSSLSDFAPLVAGSPTHMETSSPMYVAGYKSFYKEQFPNQTLAQACTAIQALVGSSADAVLNVTVREGIEADTTVPANIILKVDGRGMLAVSGSGTLLTVNRLINPGNRQIFDVDFDGGASVHIGAVASDAPLNLAWFVGASGADAGAADVFNALTCLSTIIENNGGGDLSLPNDEWEISEEWRLPSHSRIMTHGGTGSALIRLADNNTNCGVLRVREGARDIQIHNLRIDGGSVEHGNTNIHALWVRDNNVNSNIIGVKCYGVTFQNAKYGCDINPQAGGGGLEVQTVHLVDCVFLNCETDHFRSTTANCNILVEQPYMIGGAGSVFFRLTNVGTFTCRQATMLGDVDAAATPTSGGNPSALRPYACFVIGGGGGTIRIENCADEAVGRFLRNDVSVFRPVEIQNCTILSRIEISQNCDLHITNTLMPAFCIRYLSGSTPHVFLRGAQYNRNGSNILNEDNLTVTPGTERFDVLDGTSTSHIVFEESTTKGHFVNNYAKFHAVGQRWTGAPTTPWFSIGSTEAGKVLFWFGPLNAVTGARENGYAYKVIDSGARTGWMYIAGDAAAGSRGIETNCPIRAGGDVYIDNRTITAGGTTGDRTINKQIGSVNIAAGNATVTVTNSLVLATSIVQVVLMTDDGTNKIKNCIVSAGSFIVNLEANAGVEVKIGFTVW